MADIVDIFVYSLCAFVGNAGVALTGFGMAIVYIFVYQIAVLSGYQSDFKYAVFIQSLALLAAQPILLYKAEVFQHASKRMLYYFIPVTIIATPLGQMVGDRVSTDMVQAVCGILVSFAAVLEVYQKRALFASWFCGCFKKKQSCDESEGDCIIKDKDVASVHTSTEHDTSYETNLILESDFSDSCSDIVERTMESDYTVLEELGRGQYSIVKAGARKTDGKRYAIKIVEKAALLEEEDAKLQDEIAVMKQLDHPNILKLTDFYNEPRHYHIVTEIMSGGDLFGRLAGAGYFSEAYSRNVCKSVLDALQYMHSKRIAHRDLKPENLLLDSDLESATVKLADLGFAAKEKHPNSFSTMCGTPAYVAPEILKSLPYGLACDMWSLGVINFIMLAGYQPFRGETEDDVKHAIMNGNFEFDEHFFKDVSSDAQWFISNLLSVDPMARPTAPKALEDPWFQKFLTNSEPSTSDETPVFFMIGSQRSGSNWLRTMLDEREDLAGPHPPHMMRDFAPIIEKFGDLSEEDNFRVLVDHVSTFVERNQVPWTDKHGNLLKFPRTLVFNMAMSSCQRVLGARLEAGNMKELESKMYLLSVFDAIMNIYSKSNGKRLWMCKSMGMSKFHDLLLEFYGEKRLRYVYLVRDPRDVAMSFMNTPVGDCHYYAIIKKWTDLQGNAMRIVEQYPHLIHKIHYEQILKDKQTTVKGIYEFIGERRFGGIKRQASVMFMNATEDLIDGAKNGREAQKAQHLSYQFKNLGRGESFAQTQMAKWKHPETGLPNDAIEIIESIAHEVMGSLGYATHLVNVSMPPRVYTNQEIEFFNRLNADGIKKMNDDLKVENPGDFERRQIQSSTLELMPILKADDWSVSDASTAFFLEDSSGFLSSDDLHQRTTVEKTEIAAFKTGRAFRWVTATLRGYYPNEHDKPNQDAFSTHKELSCVNGEKVHWFSVYDGHGPHGHKCSETAATNIPYDIGLALGSGLNAKLAMEKAHLQAHDQMCRDTNIDTSLSGTTATSVILRDDGHCIIGNVGDSTCILGSANEDNMITAHRLCTEHTPLRADERERIRAAGGVIMTVDQRDGVVPVDENWTKEDPPRIWSHTSDKFPGCGFTRSLGDEVAHSLGVSSRPELFDHKITANDRVLIVASDGITEFLDDKDCIDIVSSYPMDPAAAAAALVHEAGLCWVDRGDYMDDITAIVVFFDNISPVDLETGIELGLVCGVPQGSVDAPKEAPLSNSARFWTLFAGAGSGFLGGMCGIPGPSIILYMLHPPAGVNFTRKSQRATGAAITAVNVVMRVFYYLLNTLVFGKTSNFDRNDWVLYLFVVDLSFIGVFVGLKLFEYTKDSTTTIQGILAIFLLLCGASLLMSSYAGV